jgi:hypothetical protein
MYRFDGYLSSAQVNMPSIYHPNPPPKMMTKMEAPGKYPDRAGGLTNFMT